MIFFQSFNVLVEVDKMREELLVRLAFMMAAWPD